MTKKQKKSLTRIIIAALLMIILKFLPAEGWLRFVLYMIPYLVVGYDILRKAFKGILNKQVFDENFLMAVATIGAITLGEIIQKVWRLCSSIRLENYSRAMRLERAAGISVN